MKILQTNTFNNSFNRNLNGFESQRSVNFTAKPIKPVIEVVHEKSKIFEPIKKLIKKVFKPAIDLFNKAMDTVTTLIAKGFAKIMQTKWFTKIVNKTKDTNIVAHLSCLTSLFLSGFYMKQTLQNDKLDKQKRTTLAINQGTVAILSAIMSYSLDNVINKRINKFVDKFVMVNARDPKIGKYVDGIRSAKTIMIFGLIYRFLTPVVVTPIANKIGNRIQEKKKAELAAGK
ncbi:MAG: hypothetical protein WCY19_06860 [Candidatus Gastranaerophilaceae bacterium]